MQKDRQALRSLRWFRRLLRLLPSEFRGEWGTEMERTFQAQRREAEPGRERRRLWGSTIRGVVSTAPREHLRILRLDLGYALRMFRKNPGFTMIAVLTLALGIGAATSVFSLVDQVLLRPLPYPDPDRLVYLWTETSALGRAGFAGIVFDELQRQTSSFESLASIAGIGSSTLSGDGGPERVRRLIVSPSYFDVLGVPVQLGRGFRPDDRVVLAPEVIQGTPEHEYPVMPMVISDSLWRRRFGGERDILGKVIRMSGRPKEVIGVLPPGFRVLLPPEYDADPQRDAWWISNWDQTSFPRNVRFLLVLGRLRPRVDLGQAQAELDLFSARQRERFPEQARDGFVTRIDLLHPEVIREARRPLWTMFGAVTMVLAIACTNVAGLMLAGGMSRQGELGIRVALGAGRERLVRQMLTESLLLALVGAALGLLLARGALVLLWVIQPDRPTRFEQVRLDPRLLLFSFVAAAVSAVAFGIIPALRYSRPHLQDALRSGSRSLGGMLRHRGRSLLVVAQIALCLVLIVGTGLLLRSFVATHRVDPGFDVRNLVGGGVSLDGLGYRDLHARLGLYRRLQERIETLPGVSAAGFATEVPFDGDFGSELVVADGALDEPRSVCFTRVTPGYLEAMQLPVRSGRLPVWRDLEDLDRPVAVVDERTAEILWPGEDAVGRRLRVERLDFSAGDRVPPEEVWMEVIGVVPAVHNESLQHPRRETVYATYNLNVWGDTNLILRTAVAPVGVLPAVRDAAAGAEPRLALPAFWSMEELLARSTADLRFTMFLLAAFGGCGLLLSAIGLYGLLSQSVRRGTGEIGLRVALGAGPSGVLRLVFGQGLRLTAAGLAAGLLLAAAFGRVLAGQLFAVEPFDPVTFLAMSGLMTIVAIGACGVPALRALRVDPLQALRSE